MLRRLSNTACCTYHCHFLLQFSFLCIYVPPLVEAFSWFGTRLYFGFSSLDISCVFACMHTNNGQHFTYRKTFNSKYLTSRIFYKTKTTIEWVVIRWKFTKLPTFIRHGCSFITNFSSKTWFGSCWFRSVFVQLFIPLLLFLLSLSCTGNSSTFSFHWFSQMLNVKRLMAMDNCVQFYQLFSH